MDFRHIHLGTQFLKSWGRNPDSQVPTSSQGSTSRVYETVDAQFSVLFRVSTAQNMHSVSIKSCQYAQKGTGYALNLFPGVKKYLGQIEKGEGEESSGCPNADLEIKPKIDNLQYFWDPQ